jgi:hypothetical protein
MRKHRFSIPKLHQIIYAEIKETSGKKGEQAETSELFFNVKIGMPDHTKILFFGEYSDGWARNLSQEHEVVFTSVVAEEIRKAEKDEITATQESPYILANNAHADWLFSFEPAEYYATQMPVLILKALADARCGIKLAYKEEQSKVERSFKLAQSLYSAEYAKKIAILSTKLSKRALMKGAGYRIYTLATNRKARELAGMDLKVIENLQKVTNGTYENALAYDKMGPEELKGFRRKIRFDPKSLMASLERINTLAEAEEPDFTHYGSIIVETE